MPQFDPQEFLDMQIAGANDTKFVPVPIGEYLAVIEEQKIRSWAAKDDPSNAGLALDVIWNIDDPRLKEQLGRDKISVKQGVMLELTEDGRGLDMRNGHNVPLGQLREAVGLNDPSVPFSFSQLPGRMAKIRVEHVVVKGDLFAQVKKNGGVAKA